MSDSIYIIIYYNHDPPDGLRRIMINLYNGGKHHDRIRDMQYMLRRLTNRRAHRIRRPPALPKLLRRTNLHRPHHPRILLQALADLFLRGLALFRCRTGGDSGGESDDHAERTLTPGLVRYEDSPLPPNYSADFYTTLSAAEYSDFENLADKEQKAFVRLSKQN